MTEMRPVTCMWPDHHKYDLSVTFDAAASRPFSLLHERQVYTCLYLNRSSKPGTIHSQHVGKLWSLNNVCWLYEENQQEQEQNVSNHQDVAWANAEQHHRRQNFCKRSTSTSPTHRLQHKKQHHVKIGILVFLL